MADLSAFFGEDEEEFYEVEENFIQIDIGKEESNILTKESNAEDLNQELTEAINTPIPINSEKIDFDNDNENSYTEGSGQYSDDEQEELSSTPLIFLGKYDEDLEFESFDSVYSLEYLTKSIHARSMPRKVWAAQNMTKVLAQIPWIEGFKHAFSLSLFVFRNQDYEFRFALAETFDELLIHLYRYIDIKDDYSQDEFGDIDFDEDMYSLLELTILGSRSQTLGSSSICLSKLAQFFSQSSFESLNHFLSLVLKFMNNPEMRSFDSIDVLPNSMRILSQLIPHFSTESINNDIIPVLTAMVSHQIYQTRKECIPCVKYLITSIYNSVDFDHIVSLYSTLISDSNHEVRHEACMQLRDFADIMIAQNKQESLMNWMVLLLDDNSSKVKTCAQNIIGPVIYAFRDQSIPHLLMEKYLEMQHSPKPEVRLNCAKNFPGVLLALGPDGWSILKDTFFQLSKDSSTEVKIVIVSFLHEFPSIISPQDMGSDVVSIIEEFLDENEYQISFALANNAAKLLTTLEPHLQDRISSKLYESISDLFEIPMPSTYDNNSSRISNWRKNLHIIEYVNDLIPFLNAELILKRVVPFILDLFKHSLSHEIKQFLISSFPIIFKRLGEIDTTNDLSSPLLLDIATDLSLSSDYKSRQYFIMVCSEIIQANPDHKYIHESILPSLTKLSQDRVKSVQACLARFLKHFPDLLGTSKAYQQQRQTQFFELFNSLRSIEDFEVQYELSQISPFPTS